jgi:FAD synthase
MPSRDINMMGTFGDEVIGHAPTQAQPTLGPPILPFLLGGVVVEGDHRGRELGYPTANVAVVRWDATPEGVFAGTVRRADGSLYRSAVSVGRRETFYNSEAPILVEAFLLDFSGDLYGEYLRVELVGEIRQQRRFTSVEELIDEIENDVVEVRRMVNLGARRNGRPSKRGDRNQRLRNNRRDADVSNEA